MPDHADDLEDGAEQVLYAVRQVGAGWTVYDYRTLEPVRVHGRLQIGLEYGAAKALAEDLARAWYVAAQAAATLPQAA